MNDLPRRPAGKLRLVIAATLGALMQSLFALGRVDLLSFGMFVAVGILILITRGRFLKDPKDMTLPSFLLGIILLEISLIILTRV